MFSLELPRRDDSNQYTQHTSIHIRKKITQNYLKFAFMGCFSKGLKNEFETAMVNEPSVLKPLKFDCAILSLPSLYGEVCLTTGIWRFWVFCWLQSTTAKRVKM